MFEIIKNVAFSNITPSITGCLNLPHMGHVVIKGQLNRFILFMCHPIASESCLLTFIWTSLTSVIFKQPVRFFYFIFAIQLWRKGLKWTLPYSIQKLNDIKAESDQYPRSEWTLCICSDSYIIKWYSIMQIRKKKMRPPTKVAITGLLGDLQNGFLCLYNYLLFGNSAFTKERKNWVDC